MPLARFSARQRCLYFCASPFTPVAPYPLSCSFEQERGEGVGGSEVRCLALIRLDGADTALVHRVKVNRATLRVGLRVMAVFAENRSGSILDIVHFRHLKI